MNVIDVIVDEILVDGLDDWVPVVAIDAFAEGIDPVAGAQARGALVVDAIMRIVDLGWAEPGRVEHREWTALTTPREEWPRELSREADGVEADGWSIWLRLTDAGSKAAAGRFSVLPDPLDPRDGDEVIVGLVDAVLAQTEGVVSAHDIDEAVHRSDPDAGAGVAGDVLASMRARHLIDDHGGSDAIRLTPQGQTLAAARRTSRS
jgi:hypothetical protein